MTGRGCGRDRRAALRAAASRPGPCDSDILGWLPGFSGPPAAGGPWMRGRCCVGPRAGAARLSLKHIIAVIMALLLPIITPDITAVSPPHCTLPQCLGCHSAAVANGGEGLRRPSALIDCDSCVPRLRWDGTATQCDVRCTSQLRAGGCMYAYHGLCSRRHSDA